MRAGPFISRLCLLLLVADCPGASDFNTFLKPLFSDHCITCHGEKKTKGKVNLKELRTAKQFLAKPGLIKEMIEAIDARDMPPEDEPELDEKIREKLLVTLRGMLREATEDAEVKSMPIRRLNRFQYNNAVRDLFQMNRAVFSLPEKLMTREGHYLQANPSKMPDRVNVACKSLDGSGGLKGVDAYPKDLRAAHGFDNQADQLSLSPLHLDTFLKLSVSILESPDFNPGTVGVWKDFFAAPVAGADLRGELAKRLQPFLEQAFRNAVEAATLKRYTDYAATRITQGLPFAEAMKKVASAVLPSPLFLYRHEALAKDQPYHLASRLSFFLWGSSPDAELLRLAGLGTLSTRENLDRTIDRMLADPKIERFLDAFPAQWMQLENVLAVTPDPKQHRLFSLDEKHPASLHMVLEPLLLFDAVFVEDRPVIDLIAPTFGYQSDFLKTWYGDELKPREEDLQKAIEDNENRKKRIVELGLALDKKEKELGSFIEPIRKRLLAERATAAEVLDPVDLRPVAAWEFEGDLKSSVGSFPLKKHGAATFREGMVVLNGSYLQSPPLPFELRAKSLEAWFLLKDLNQRGGGVMGIQGPGDFFDTIVLGERKPRHWISGSNGFSRTDDFADSQPEKRQDEMIHLVMTYQTDGLITLYRNGEVYGKPYKKPLATFPKGKSSVLFGLRHLPPGGGKHLSVRIDKARLYDRALSEKEVAEAARGNQLFVSNKELLAALSPEQRKAKGQLEKQLKDSRNALKRAPKPVDANKLKGEAQKRFDNAMRNKMRSQVFERTPTSDPRYGGIITNAGMLSMTSGPRRTHPIARGAWIIEVILNDPPPPPPNDVPPLDEDAGAKTMTIREQFAVHRKHPDCAGCHAKLDPLGFALENFGVTGRWRDRYENGRDVDPSGILLRRHAFDGVVRFKASLVKEEKRFARAFIAHLLRFALSRELRPADALAVDAIVQETEKEGFRLKSLIREVIRSDVFLRSG